MNQCFNKLLGSLDHMYEALFQKQLKYLQEGGSFDHQLEDQQSQSQNSKLLILHQNSHQFYTLVHQRQCLLNVSQFIAEQNQRKISENASYLSDTINKVDSYSRDASLLNLFDDQQEQHQNLNQQDNHQIGHRLQTIIEENKIQNNSHEGYQSQNQSQQFIRQQQQPKDSNPQEQDQTEQFFYNRKSNENYLN